MGFLNPLFLIAGLSVAVPLLLHLWHRQETKDFDFPAIRYLLRTEREHSRKIRARQLLLLLLRVAILLVIVVLGARLHVPGPGGAHEPTALVLILDNSMSSSLVEEGSIRLDALKETALRSIEAAGPDDVVWVIRAGSPSSPALPGVATQAAQRIRETGVSHGRGDLAWALRRARNLVNQSPLPGKEIHLFTDLQASAFPEQNDSGAGEGEQAIPIVVFAPEAEPFSNRSVASVLVGGGLPPLAGQRSEVAVDIGGSGETTPVGVRVFIDGQVRGATQAPIGTTVTLPLGPFPSGRVEGYVEIDPDPLVADDRRYFAFDVRRPTPVAVAGNSSFFLEQALGVLEGDGRTVAAPLQAAEAVVAIAGDGLEERRPGQRMLIFPPSDPARIPALNVRLTNGRIPATYGPPSVGGATVETSSTSRGLDGVRVTRYHAIQMEEGSDVVATPMATLSTGDAWILTGETDDGSFVLFGSPLEPSATDLPISAAMIPLMEWAVDHGAIAAGDRSLEAGRPFTPPAPTEFIETPSGTRIPVDGDQPFHLTEEAGPYRAVAGDSVLATFPVNPPTAESSLDRLSRGQLEDALGPSSVVVEAASRWERAIFNEGRGPEPWRALLVLLLVLLVAESIVAASERLLGQPVPRAVIDPSQPESARA